MASRPRISAADAALWRKAIADVEPLRRAPPKPSAPAKPVPDAPAVPPAPAGPAPPPSRIAGAAPVAAPRPSPRAPAPGLDQRTQQRLRRGQLAVEGRLDLHGMTQVQAHGALAAYVARSRLAGRRCILVITGKGGRREGDVGVLRASVPRWLAEPALAAHVLAHAPARPQHGGDGALYVLLRRIRETPATG